MSRKPTKAESEHMSKVADLGCIVCLMSGFNSPCEIHHIDGKVKPGAHFKIIGLCFQHHRAGQDNKWYTSRHPHKARFENRYGDEHMLMDVTNTLLYGSAYAIDELIAGYHSAS